MNHILIELGINPDNSPESKALAEKFNKETIFVSRIFSRFLSGWRPKNLLKIAILIVDSLEKDHIISPNSFTKAAVLYRYFDLGAFDLEQNQIKRYQALLDFMLNSLIEASKQFSWSANTVFTEAYSKVIASNFINEYSLLPSKLSPDKNHLASVDVRVDRDFSTLYLEMIDVNKKVKKIEIIKVAQHKDKFIDISGSIRWIDSSELMVSNIDNEIHFKYSLLSQTIETVLTPNIHDEEYLLDELKLISPDTSKAESLDIIKRRIGGTKDSSSKK